MPADQLQIRTSLGTRDGQKIVRLSGPLTIATLFGFQELVRSDKSTGLILDFSEVPYVDSAGLGSVLGAYVSRQKDGRKLALVGVSERVMNVFKLTRVDQFFSFHPSIPAAEQALEDSSQAVEG
ncbi:MAG TPA: STAS domain-containing protein [Terriglobales bacterium]|nr:STAS domain-containing protein [Terriglobales bacterium]